MKYFPGFNSTLSIIKKFRKRILFKNYFKTCFVFILIPFLITGFIFAFYQSQKNDLIIKNELNNSFFVLKETTNSSFDIANRHLYQLVTDNYVNAFVHAEKIPADIPMQQSKSLMNKIIFSNNFINAIEIYSFKTDYVLSTRVPAFRTDLSYTPWYDYYEESGESTFVIPSVYKDSIGTNEICMCAGIYRKNTLHAIVVIYIDPSDIIIDAPYNSNYHIVNKDKIVLYSSDKNLIGKKSDLICSKQLDTTKDVKISFSDNSKYILCESFFNNNLLFITESKSTNSAFSSSVIFTVLVCFLLIIIIALILSFYISQNFYQAIEKMLSYFSISSDSKLENDFADNINELQYVQHNIQNIVDISAQLESDLISKTLQLKSAQTVALQTQFSSHFLFNTLNLVNMKAIALTKSENEISATITLLSDLLFTALNSSQNLITVRDEIDFAKKFIQIEGLRYEDSFDVSWDIDENVLNLYTLKLILQPIIENAFTHGIFRLPPDIRGKLKISVKTDENGKNLLFTVSDNGIATKEDIMKIQDILDNSGVTINSIHIGISNVNSRIKLLFNQSYGCSVSRKDDYTTFTIKIPVLNSNNIDDKF